MIINYRFIYRMSKVRYLLLLPFPRAGVPESFREGVVVNLQLRYLLNKQLFENLIIKKNIL